MGNRAGQEMAGSSIAELTGNRAGQEMADSSSRTNGEQSWPGDGRLV